MSIYATEKLVTEARRLAAEFRKATGQALGISGEIAEFDAAKLLNLDLITPKPGGYDAVGKSGAWKDKRVQIKGRVLFEDSKGRARIGQMKTDMDWDSIVLVVMDDDYEAIELYECDREVVENALEEAPKNKRGAMSVAKFKKISTLVWTKVDGLLVEDEELAAYHASL